MYHVFGISIWDMYVHMYLPSCAFTPKIFVQPVCLAVRSIASACACDNLALASGVNVSCCQATCLSFTYSTHPTKAITNSWKKCNTCRYLQFLFLLMEPSAMLLLRHPGPDTYLS